MAARASTAARSAASFKSARIRNVHDGSKRDALVTLAPPYMYVGDLSSGESCNGTLLFLSQLKNEAIF